MSGGIVDKYMGDGILAFWTGDAEKPKELARRVDECIYQLIGTSLGIAKEWQEQIDFSVRPTGMRCGAALGKVLFISENRDGKHPIHAISESINLSARLQSAAEPNTFVIANRLRKSYFADDPDFVEMEPLEAKNIGEVRAWKKDYEMESAAGAKASSED
jgi:class 3 adenylate cyclase